jgi:hypothetical protein
MSGRLAALSFLDEGLAQYDFVAVRERDAKFIANGGRILYAIDSNIVLFLLDPAGRALPGSRRRLGYAGIFSDDPKDAAELLAGALAEFIEKQPSNDMPLLLIPPIDGWTYVQAQRLIDQATDKPDDAAQAAAANYIAALEADAPSGVLESDDLAKKEEIAAGIARLAYLESGAPARLRRLDTLLGDPPRLLSTVEISRDARFPAALRAGHEEEFHDRLDHSFRRSRWLTAFGRVRNRGETIAAMSADAMAHLERWNLRLERAGVRILFISGDSSLFEAGKVVEFDRPKDAVGHFTELFLRHPRSFLPDLQFLQLPGANAGTGNVTHFLDVWPQLKLDPGIPPKKSVDSVEPQRKAAELRDAVGGQLEDLRARWHDFLISAAAQFKTRGPLLEPQTEWQQNAAETLIAWQKRLKAALDRRMEEMWESCFRVATRAHLVFGNAGMRANPRLAPRLFVEGWPKTHELIAELVRLNSATSFDVAVYETKLKEIEQEVRMIRRNDPDGGEGGFRYAYYLVHGALFAGKGEWRVAANVAAYAYERRTLATGLTPDGANGREARYLEAVCRRFDARGCEDLDVSRTLLREARGIAQQESADCVRERFDVEECAIEYARAMFRTFFPKPGVTPCQKEEFAAITTKLYAVRDTINQRLSRLNTEEEGRKSILRSLAVRTAVNIVSLALLEPGGPGVPDESALLLLRENHASGNLHHFGRVVLACAEARVAGRDGLPARRARQEVERLLPEGGNWEDLLVVPYDRPRINRMRDVALGRVMPS